MTILLSPQAKSDPSVEDLRNLADAISAAVGQEVEIAPAPEAPPGTAGVTLWEVINVFGPWEQAAVDAVTLGTVVVAFVKWARTRFRDRNGRPKVVRILGVDGRVIKVVKLANAGDEPEDATAEEQRRGVVYRRPNQR